MGTRVDAEAVVLECCAREIVKGIGATTEALHHAVIPMLLESGLMAEFRQQRGDMTPLLEEVFDFSAESGQWQLRENDRFFKTLPHKEIKKYFVCRFLQKATPEKGPSANDVLDYLRDLAPEGSDSNLPEAKNLLEEARRRVQRGDPSLASSSQPLLF